MPFVAFPQPSRSPRRACRRTTLAITLVVGFVLASPGQGVIADARPADDVAQAPSDSAAVAETVDRFHKAIVAGDSVVALSLLASDAVVLESGGIETRDEFRSRHLPADIAFAQAVKSERGPMRVVVRGDAAWVTSTSTTTGEFRGRQVNSSGVELIVLARSPQGWRIVAIHWSSRARRPAGG